MFLPVQRKKPIGASMAGQRFLFPSPDRSVAALDDVAAVSVRRKQPCRFCGEKHAHPISQITFWDIAASQLVICPRCRLAQLDPMLTEKSMSTGVYAYYLMQRAGESEKSRRKNAARNFRKGFAFACALPKNSKPLRVLELGPGDGHFLRGVRSVFPNAEFFAWDIVPEVARAMAEEHGFTPLSGGFEKLKSKVQFDLIIARDVIEHFAETDDVLRQVVKLLNPGGLFHFITPNGHEDLWKFYAGNALRKGQTAELLLNHVNYFDGAGLDQFLQHLGLEQLEFYSYDFSSWKTGIGWKVAENLAAGVHGFSAAETIRKFKKTSALPAAVKAPPVPDRVSLLEKIWFRYKAWRLLKLSPRNNFGHEIHGLYRKA